MENNPIRVLLVDDDEEDFVILRDLLAEVEGTAYSTDWASHYEAAIAQLERKAHDVYLVDYRLGAQTGLDLIRYAVVAQLAAPMILLTGFGDRDVDREAMRLGASDFLVKGQISAPLLERSIRYSIHQSRMIGQLKEREESFRRLFDSTFEGVIVHDTKGAIIKANRAAEAIFGIESGKMQGSPILSYFDGKSREAVERLFSSSEQGSIEVEGRRADGARIWTEVAGKPYTSGGAPAWLLAIRDVTAKKEMEAQLLMQDRLASVGLLASSLAHEIGTPLGVIRGRAEYLAMQLEDPVQVKKSADIIITQIDRVSKLIRSLLNLARGDRSAGVGKVDAAQIVGNVSELMAHEFRRRGVEFETEFPEGVIALIRAEAEPLSQVLLNLLVNAVHAIEAAVATGRSENHRIHVTLSDLGSQWVLGIEDTGCGITRENMRNLFKPFFTTKDIGIGTGLGLVTSYNIVHGWGGSITVESEEGVGTTFRVVLPKL